MTFCPRQAGREAFRDTGNDGFHALRGFHGIGAGFEVDADAQSGRAVQLVLRALALGAEFDTRHVPHPKDRAVLARAQDDIAELGGCDEPALGLDIELELLLGADRLGADGADGRLGVLRLDRRDDVGG